MIITGIIQDSQKRIIKVRIDDQLRESMEVWNLIRTAGARVLAEFPSGERRIVDARGSLHSRRRYLSTKPDRSLRNNLDELPYCPVRILVFGDSIAWGQGLPRTQKIPFLVAREISRINGGEKVQIDNYAHSGAIIGPGGGNSGDHSTIGLDNRKENRLGEVPDSFPSASRQVDAFLDQDGGFGRRHIDFIILCAGINSVGLENILKATHRRVDIGVRVRNKIDQFMPPLLEKIVRSFPNARVFVLGYYPIVTWRSRPSNLAEAAMSIGYLKGTTQPDLAVLLGDGKRNVIRNCATFIGACHTSFQRIVNDVNATLSNPRVSLAIPDFKERHALFAPASRLFELSPTGAPQDPMASRRRPLCLLAGGGVTQTQFCIHTSVGHPTKAGAELYARAVLSTL